jgi:hypothetical protein
MADLIEHPKGKYEQDEKQNKVGATAAKLGRKQHPGRDQIDMRTPRALLLQPGRLPDGVVGRRAA